MRVLVVRLPEDGVPADSAEAVAYIAKRLAEGESWGQVDADHLWSVEDGEDFYGDYYDEEEWVPGIPYEPYVPGQELNEFGKEALGTAEKEGGS